ncbi:lactadherin-like [Dendronephthya gigantea]|nr:lactadherin-like [Dendronephthya gigantea]
MQSGTIPDSAVTASSFFRYDYKPYFARLDKTGGTHCAWSPINTAMQGSWIQVNLRKMTTVTGMTTQGQCFDGGYAKSSSFSYSNDGENWNIYYESGSMKIFQWSNSPSSTTHTFKTHVIAQYIRVMPESWHRYPALRLEFYGCY